MRILPRAPFALVKLTLLPFQVYVIAAFPALEICAPSTRPERSQYFSDVEIMISLGYLLSAVALGVGTLAEGLYGSKLRAMIDAALAILAVALALRFAAST